MIFRGNCPFYYLERTYARSFLWLWIAHGIPLTKTTPTIQYEQICRGFLNKWFFSIKAFRNMLVSSKIMGLVTEAMAAKKWKTVPVEEAGPFWSIISVSISPASPSPNSFIGIRFVLLAQLIRSVWKISIKDGEDNHPHCSLLPNTEWMLTTLKRYIGLFRVQRPFIAALHNFCR